MKDFNFDSIFEKFSGGAKKITQNVASRANETVESAKISWAIGEAEKKIADCKMHIGDIIYNEYLKSKDFEGVIGEMCEKIDNLNEEIEAMQDKKAEIKSEKRCASCGAFNKQNGVFCSVCGEKLGDEVENDGEEI